MANPSPVPVSYTHLLEVTPEAREAIRKILAAGWTITNQLVYNVAVSRRGHTAKLRKVLNGLGAVSYTHLTAFLHLRGDIISIIIDTFVIVAPKGGKFAVYHFFSIQRKFIKADVYKRQEK